MRARANSSRFRIGLFLFVAIALVGSEIGEVLSQSAPEKRGASAQGQTRGALKGPWQQLPDATFPHSGKNKLASPNSRYVLENLDGPPPARGDRVIRDWHTIYLIDTKRHTRELIYRYGRWVNVLWSPSSEALVVNDIYASDDSRSMLFVLTPEVHLTNLGELLLGARIPAKERELMQDGYPVFKFVTRWLDSESLLFKVSGYAEVDEKGFKDPFTFVYLYRLEGSLVPASNMDLDATAK